MRAGFEAFERIGTARLLAGGSASERALAAELSRRTGLRAEALDIALPLDPPTFARVVWDRLAAQTPEGPVLLVLDADRVRACAASALGLEWQHALGLQLDPGRAVCLRNEPEGVVLRHWNVRGPPKESGTPLPRPPHPSGA